MDVLRRLASELSEDRMLDVLDEALDARIIEDMPGSLGEFQFTHALIQETLAAELSANRVVRMHARIAEARKRPTATAPMSTLRSWQSTSQKQRPCSVRPKQSTTR